MRNLCTFLLGLFRSIISSLVNYYYLISFFYFNQFHLSTCTRYYISYFIAISCCRHHQFCLLFTYDPLSAIYLQSLGARPNPNHTNSATTLPSIITTLSSILLRPLHLRFHTDLLISFLILITYFI